MMRGPCTGQVMSIPREVVASVAVAQGYRFVGEFGISLAPRLREVTGAQALPEPLQVDLLADAYRGQGRLRGTVRGNWQLECQRCNRPFLTPVDLKLDLALVHSEEAEKALLSEADPYLVQDDQLPLYELIEEELLLALPVFPRCKACEDAVEAAAHAQPPQSPQQKPERENPFAALKQQLKSSQE